MGKKIFAKGGWDTPKIHTFFWAKTSAKRDGYHFAGNWSNSDADVDSTHKTQNQRLLVHSGESDGVVEDAEYGGDGAARSTPGWFTMVVIDGRDDDGDDDNEDNFGDDDQRFRSILVNVQ